MEFLYIALLLVIIYLVVANKNGFNERIEHLEDRILELQRLLRQNSVKKPTIENFESVTSSEKIEEHKKPESPIEPLIPVLSKGIEKEEEVFSNINTSPARHQSSLTPPRAYVQPESELSFFERHPNLENFIGENLINKIGIAILVLAIGFFVKYAIDNNWVGPAGRVGIGILCGGVLIGLAHRLRNSYKAFSSVLVGGGLAIFYFTITLAYHQFHLFNQTTSFVILIVITCFAVVLSLLYDKQELAVIALIGGLASPFMVSTGNANYNALFIYMVILNAGLLVIAYNKLWRILNASAFALTVLVVLTVMLSLPDTNCATVFLYISILYLLFVVINVANNVKENKKFITSDFTILLTNTALYFAAGLYLLTAMHHGQIKGLFSISLATINLVLSFLLFKTKKADTNILYLLIGITLTFISLTAPIQLNGHYVTLFWAAESVLLYWLYQKSTIKLMKLTSLIIWGAMLISLWIDWLDIYSNPALQLTILANKGFITTLVTAIGSYLLYLLIKRDGSEQVYGIKVYGGFYKYAAFILLFLSGLLEINHQFLNRYPHTYLNSLYMMLYVPGLVYIFYIVSKQLSATETDGRILGVLLSLCIIVYLFFNSRFFDTQYMMLVQHKVSSAHFAAHLVGAVFIGLIFYHLIMLAKNNLSDELGKLASWVIAGAIVLFLSLEVCLASNFLFYSGAYSIEHIETVYIKTGLPVLWGLFSFALMWLGMRNKIRTLRIISLTLFSITLFKLFLFDIQNIPPAGKIVAFFCLGVLLLIISFMYQKVKKIIVQDEVIEE